MVKNCNNADLAESNIDSKYYLLYQLWKELTAKKTLDTYQFRLMNTLSALNELIKVINQRLERIHSSNHNIEDCKSETMEIVKDDLVLQEYYPIVRTRLLSHLNEKADTDAQQRVLRHQLDYALATLKPYYFEKLVDSLKNSIDQGYSAAIISKTNQLVSCCSSRGWSNEALYSVIGTLYGSKTDLLAWEKFKNKLCSTETEEY